MVTEMSQFAVLLEKSALVECRRKMIIAFEFLVAFFILILLRPHRQYNKNDSVFKAVEIDSLASIRENLKDSYSSLKWSIAYSPKNPLIDKLINDTSDLLLLDKPIPFENSEKLHNYLKINDTFVGIEFDTINILKWNRTVLPKHLKYSLIFPQELRTYMDLTNKHASEFVWQPYWPDQLSLTSTLPKNIVDNDGAPGYISEGFLTIQNALFKAFMHAQNNQIKLPKILMQRLPYKQTEFQEPANKINSYVTSFITFIYLLPAIHFLQSILKPEQSPFKQILRVHDVGYNLHWVALFFVGFTRFLFLNAFVVGMLKLSLIHYNDMKPELYMKSDWRLLLLFFMLYSCSLLTFLFLFSMAFKSHHVATAALLLIWLSNYVFFLLLLDNLDELFAPMRYFLLIIPNNSFLYGFLIIKDYEGDIGMGWTNILERFHLTKSYIFGMTMLILFLTSIAFMGLTLYWEQLQPGKYVNPQKFWFLCKKSFWFRNSHNFENENIIKDQSWKLYLSGIISVLFDAHNLFRAQDNEITVILDDAQFGTTMLSSNFIDLLILEKDNAEQITKRPSQVPKIGVCFQESLLYDKLTPLEHMDFFVRLKGVEPYFRSHEVDDYMLLTNLIDLENTKCGLLDAGQKYALNLCIAACGGSKVIICDHPSMNLSIEEQRYIWRLLNALKNGRRIFVLTNDCEEASAIGDQIVIFSRGRYKCSGDLYSLRMRYGTGYHLTLIKLENFDLPRIIEVLREYLTSYQIERQSNTEVTFSIPQEDLDKFPKLLTNLTAIAPEVGIKNFGISTPDLYDIHSKFVTVPYRHTVMNKQLKFNGERKIHPNDLNTKKWLFIKQCHAVILKKLIMESSKQFPIWILIISVLLSALIMPLHFHSQFKSEIKSSPITISLKSYNTPKVLVENVQPFGSHTANLIENYKKLIKMENGEIVSVGKRKLSEYYRKKLKEDSFHVKTKYMCGLSTSDDGGDITVWFNSQFLHSPPICLSLAQNAIFRTDLGPSYSIEPNNRPLEISEITKIIALKNGYDNLKIQIVLGFMMPIFISYLSVFIVRECRYKMKLLQMMAGLNPLIFWFIGYLSDYIAYFIFTVIYCTTLCVIHLFEFEVRAFAEMSYVLWLYGLAAIAFTYLFSIHFNNPMIAMFTISAVNILTGLLVYTVHINVIGFMENVRRVFLIFPNYNLIDALNRVYAQNALLNSCTFLCEQESENKCNYTKLCQKTNGYCCDFEKTYWKMDFPGISTNAIYFLSTTAFFLLALIIRDRKDFIQLDWTKNRQITSRESLPDEDVRIEINRVKSIMTTDRIFQKNIIVSGVMKQGYSKALTFGFDPENNFAIYAGGHAGKSDLINVIIGQNNGKEIGNVQIGGIPAHRYYEIGHKIGYCPQRDGLMNELTGRELLRILCLIRGQPYRTFSVVFRRILKPLNLNQFMTKKIEYYSYTMRRKLSIAIALAFGSTLIVLDEPTRGLDPFTTQQIWKVIFNQWEIYRPSLLLTTRQARECSVMGNRVAVLSTHQFKHFGSVQQIQCKFSTSFLLEVKFLWSGDTQQEAQIKHNNNVKNVVDFLEKTYLKVTSVTSRGMVYRYVVLCTKINWAKIFYSVAKHKEFLRIQDYYIGQLPLSDVVYEEAVKTKHEKSDLM